ncbi:TRAP transporter substrate-binding protein [Salinarimonas soli]|uniref:TRAP transporter substrate-binding protein n=1 Tax=Salinarimonas soli TaxID=1638099 RepID=A0A5B2V9Z1_9HYPH|nr:TRAP transporter substrate-binding protein [Salinarimonas soli]KAA2235804.1 TRAP transporter substrate-binding protein [Salinarimonas soli]
MNMLARVTAGFGLAVALTTAATAQTTWDMPTPYPDGNFHTKNIREFAADVEKASSGQLKLTVHSGGSLIKHPEIKRSLRTGVAPIGEILISLHANESPVYGLDSVPFLASSYEDARKLYQAQRPALEKRLAEEGLVLLYSVAWPPQGIFAKREIKSMDDFKGLKFRTYNPGTGRIAAIAGATPVQVEVADLATAFATGRVEATITSPSTGVDAKFWDFLNYYHDTQAWLPRNMVIVNKAAYDALPDASKKALQGAAKAAEDRGWKMSQEETATRTQQLKDNKMNVVVPSPELKAGFQKIGAQIAEEWEKSAGADGKAVLEAYRK